MCFSESCHVMSSWQATIGINLIAFILRYLREAGARLVAFCIGGHSHAEPKRARISSRDFLSRRRRWSTCLPFFKHSDFIISYHRHILPHCRGNFALLDLWTVRSRTTSSPFWTSESQTLIAAGKVTDAGWMRALAKPGMLARHLSPKSRGLCSGLVSSTADRAAALAAVGGRVGLRKLPELLCRPACKFCDGYTYSLRATADAARG